MVVCEADPHPAKDVLRKSYFELTGNASQKLVIWLGYYRCCQVSPAGNTSITSDSGLPSTSAHGQHEEDTVMQQMPHGNFYDVGRTHSSFTRGSPTMLTIPLSESQRAFLQTEKHNRRIILKPWLGNHLKVWGDPISAPLRVQSKTATAFVLNKQYTKIFDSLKKWEKCSYEGIVTI